MFDQSSLVLERVTLAQLIQFMIKVLVDFASSTVFDEQSSEDSQAAHPEDLAVDNHSE